MNLSIENTDIKILYLKCRFMHKNINLEQFTQGCKDAYKQYYDKKTHSHSENIKTFSQWINGQIIALN
jgi:hypothetical protein